MSRAATTSTDFEDDITAPAGTDVSYVFSVSPLDLTGTTAQMITSFGTFTVTLSVETIGDLATTTFTTNIPRASMPVAGVYTWKIQVTWPSVPTVILQYGHGAFYVRAA